MTEEKKNYNYTHLTKLEHLKEWRMAGEFISLSELARRSGIAASTISRIETGKRANDRTLYQISHALGITVQQLIDGPGK